MQRNAFMTDYPVRHAAAPPQPQPQPPASSQQPPRQLDIQQPKARNQPQGQVG